MIKYPYVSVMVEYDPNDRKEGLSFDDALGEIAKKYKGEGISSGYAFRTGARDIEFGFNSLKYAKNFSDHARKFKGTSVSSTSCLHYGDF